MLFPLRNYWSALCCGFSLSVINVVPHTIQLESFIWTHFSLPLKCQFEHQGLGDESSGQKDSLWVTVIRWTSVSRHTLCSFWNQSLNQSVWFFTAGWMDKHLTKCLVNFHQEVQVRCYPEVPSSSVILWMYDGYFETGIYHLVYLWYISDWWSSWNFSVVQWNEEGMTCLEEFGEETS